MKEEKRVETVCPICGTFYADWEDDEGRDTTLRDWRAISGRKLPGDQCCDLGGQQQRPCVGRLIDRKAWDQREYPYDFDWCKFAADAIARTASFPTHVLHAMENFVRGVIRFGLTVDFTVKDRGEPFQESMVHDMVSEAWTHEKKKDQEQRMSFVLSGKRVH